MHIPVNIKLPSGESLVIFTPVIPAIGHTLTFSAGQGVVDRVEWTCVAIDEVGWRGQFPGVTMWLVDWKPSEASV